ncbi:hypothetical protein hrd7_03440 [Leptolinea sp. HRD-7]|nr:hypothetical protein hrd7_03440 [Leptolinea sp. HRD-7]
MVENKTVPTGTNVSDFIDRVADDQRKNDCREIIRLMQDVSGQPPVMWGSSIVGFGSYHCKYASGREGDMPVIAFSPRKQAITIYVKSYFEAFVGEISRLDWGSIKRARVACTSTR